MAGRADGRLVDLREPLREDVALEIVTARDPVAGEIIRHSAEHIMADAVKRCFPKVQIDVGRTDHSEKFQYDFLVDDPFTAEDLEQITASMQAIVAENTEFERTVVSREEARSIFSDLGETLKLSRLDDIPEDAEITYIPPREVCGSVSRPPRGADRSNWCLSTARGFRLLLAGRRVGSKATAGLWHSLCLEEGSKGSSGARWRKRRSEIIAASAWTWSFFISTQYRRARPFICRRG